ncbi:MAG: GTPase Era [Anaerolineaceae bacterium]|nr:GTPase Era [Anaerolineaceae bacterium]
MKASPPFRTGYAAVVGKPNVGKSTLVNALLGQKIAAVSPRPQTTRRRQLGILTLPNAQIIFVDTPGIHEPVHKLGEFMNSETAATLEDADIIVWVVDVSSSPTAEDELAAGKLTAIEHLPPVILALNKADLTGKEALVQNGKKYQALDPGVGTILPLSAVSGFNQEKLLAMLIESMPEGAPFFDEDQVTDFYEREIAADLIREAALHHLRDEIPHAVAVRIDEFKERDKENAYIAATLMVDKESHKGIIIGKGGAMLKKIGTTARLEIERMSGRKVFLELRVKVNKNWRNDANALKWLGYNQNNGF